MNLELPPNNEPKEGLLKIKEIEIEQNKVIKPLYDLIIAVLFKKKFMNL